MPIKTGDYQELKFFERIVDSGILSDIPGYAVRMLLLLIRHANFPSGWTWPGKVRAEKLLGLNRNYQLRAHYVLLRKGLYKAWGYAKTKSHKGLAFKLNLEVPSGEVPAYEIIKRELWDSLRPKDKTGTMGLLLANCGTSLGQLWDVSDIKKDITLKNPKEPIDSQKNETPNPKKETAFEGEPFQDAEQINKGLQGYLEKPKVEPPMLTAVQY